MFEPAASDTSTPPVNANPPVDLRLPDRYKVIPSFWGLSVCAKGPREDRM